MDRTTVLTGVLALLAVLAIAVAAATLDSTTAPTGGQFGVGSGQRGSAGDDAGFSANASVGAPGGGPLVSLCSPFLGSTEGKLLVLGLFLLLFLAVSRTTESYAIGAIFCVSFAIPSAILYFVLTLCHPVGDPTSALVAGVNGTLLPAGGGGLPGQNRAAEAIPTPSALLGVLLVAALLGSVVLLLVSTGDDEADGDELSEEAAVEPTDAAAVGRAAGRAADRIETESDVENEVYRAWAEMTDHLDVANPESSTPTEFAAAAVDAGLARDDVEDLTRLFEEVRYGGATPTAEREREAVDALRRIEAAYATENATPSVGSDDEQGGNR